PRAGTLREVDLETVLYLLRLEEGRPVELAIGTDRGQILFLLLRIGVVRNPLGKGGRSKKSDQSQGQKTANHGKLLMMRRDSVDNTSDKLGYLQSQADSSNWLVCNDAP